MTNTLDDLKTMREVLVKLRDTIPDVLLCEHCKESLEDMILTPDIRDTVCPHCGEHIFDKVT